MCSSRSHCVYKMKIGYLNSNELANVYFVDLAGVERNTDYFDKPDHENPQSK